MDRTKTVCSVILIQAKHCQRLSKPPLNVLPVFIITEQTVLVQSIYVKQASWGSLYLSATLVASRQKLQLNLPSIRSPWVNIRSGASQWRALGRSRIESILVLPIYVTLRLLLCCVRFTDFPFIVEWLGQTILHTHFSPWIEEVVWVAMGFRFQIVLFPVCTCF